MSWVKPVFGAEAAGSSREPRQTHEVDSSIPQGKKSKMFEVWTDSFPPSTKEDLALHFKKYEELEVWLTESLTGFLGFAPIALLIGPSGCSKTSSVKILAKYLPCTIKEWINELPSSQTDSYATTTYHQGNPSNQVSKFEDFLFRGGRYKDLFESNSTHSVLLVKDIPNAFIQDPSLLSKTLQKYRAIGRTPLIFICTNDTLNLGRKLFNPQLRRDFNIRTINFNPIHDKLMIKALLRILNLIKRDHPELEPKCNVGDIVLNANGDIRFGINQMQYMILGHQAPFATGVPLSLVIPDRKLIGIKPVKTARTSSKRDMPIDIFRFVGKTLYNRGDETNSDAKVKKEKTSLIPQEISSKMSSVPHLFHGLLLENYSSVRGDIKYISVAAALLSQTDVIMASSYSFEEKNIGKIYSVDVSVHGLMSLPPDNAQRKFCPFKGSRCREVVMSIKEKQNECRDLFPGFCLQPRTLMMEVCPFLVHLDKAAFTLDQMKFIFSVAQLTSISSSGFVRGDEEESDEDQPITVAEVPNEIQPEFIQIGNKNEDEFIHIEEFSSDDSSNINNYD